MNISAIDNVIMSRKEAPEMIAMNKKSPVYENESKPAYEMEEAVLLRKSIGKSSKMQKKGFGISFKFLSNFFNSIFHSKRGKIKKVCKRVDLLIDVNLLSKASYLLVDLKIQYGDLVFKSKYYKRTMAKLEKANKKDKGFVYYFK